MIINPMNRVVDQDLKLIAEIISRKLDGRLQIIVVEDRNTGTKTSLDKTALRMYMRGETVGTLRVPNAQPKTLLIQNLSISKSRVSSFQNSNEAVVREFASKVPNAVRTILNNIHPRPFYSVYLELLSKINQAYTAHTNSLKHDVSTQTSNIMRKYAQYAAGLMGVDIDHSLLYTVYLVNRIAQSLCRTDKEALFFDMMYLFDNDAGAADNFNYSVDKMLTQTRNLVKTMYTSSVYIEELVDSSVRVVDVEKASTLKTMVMNAGNRYEGTDAIRPWNDPVLLSKQYLTVYPNMQELPADMFSKMATLKAAGDGTYVPGVGIMITPGKEFHIEL